MMLSCDCKILALWPHRQGSRRKVYSIVKIKEIVTLKIVLSALRLEKMDGQKL
jgi:hypothetical protein